MKKRETLQDSILRLEHECEIGLPHDPSTGCRRCGMPPPVPERIPVATNIRYPSQDEWTRMVNERYGPG